MQKAKLKKAILMVFIVVLGVHIALKAPAIVYFEKLKTSYSNGDLSDEQTPSKRDPQTGRVLERHIYYTSDIDRVITFLLKTPVARPVKTVPVLSPPIVHIGDKVVGNNKKLYYISAVGTIEYSLSEKESLGFLLFLGELGTVYPEAREAFAEGVIRQLQREIKFGDHDTVARYNGELLAINIETQETADLLFACIRNCSSMLDVTNKLGPDERPDCTIQINWDIRGDIRRLSCKYKKTGRTIRIIFSEEDTQKLREYVMSLPYITTLPAEYFMECFDKVNNPLSVLR